ncbi:hypothetical protein GQ55_5G064600 [Panicum hallii var. hallii]|uniref:Methyltransferase type 11 domain-containing protein n=1 Tax=Panicum hallii var. hallii TaxID=1504633 RepID=A0A2T7DDG6_9POAL|nr:hypothetical protein GQ55_5G064600 [Panicum hallii var. hallii]
MGIMEGYPRKPITQHQSQMDALPAGASSSCSSATHAPPAPHHATAKKRHYSDRTKMILLFLLTNSVSILLSVSFSHVTGVGSGGGDSGLDFALSVLSSSQSLAVDLHRRVEATDVIIKRLISNSGRMKRDEPPPQLTPEEELTLALGPHTLPFGYTPNLDSDKLYPAVGAACHRHRDELRKYMSYNMTGDCPSDEALAESLMLRGCEPLPRRRCRARGPAGFPDPTPFPESLWVIPPDKSVSWGPYSCKNYSCLVDRARRPGSHDCKACFDLAGKEQRRWVGNVGDLDYDIDTVLGSKPRGTIRIGLDIGGGTGTFAARMAERGVTVVTTALDLGAPFGAFVASRGLIPLHLGAVAGRLPFFDGTLDIVHSAHVLSRWIPGEVLDAELYDIYRVLRPGGIFWLDHFFCTGKELTEVYVPIIEKVGFRKLRWNTGRKLDKGPNADEWYISALLERPMM